ncbi:MAG: hypothetical protein ACD_5C00008G0007 [uncultured bacterium]|nr:MAG: hypothetical protein ACD_5C00008G0007 [uncultured bacterium]
MKEKFFLVLMQASDMYIAPHIPGELYGILRLKYPKAAVSMCKEGELAEREEIYDVKNGKRIRTEVGHYLACYYEYEIDE